MSDLVERVARAIYEADDPWHKAWPWPDLQSDQAGVDQYRRIAEAALAAMQADAEPVAWMYQDNDEVQPYTHVQLTRAPNGAYPYWTETPLYAHPPVADRQMTTKPVDDRESGNTDIKPALKPAVEVWWEARQAYHATSNPYPSAGAEAAAAVIEADRQAIIAAKDAEIAALQAHADALAVELQQIEVDAMEHYNDWMEHGCEKAEATRFVFDLGEYARKALRAYEEFRRG